VATAAKPALAPLRVLLMGAKEEDFFVIREILERSRSSLAAELDHAHSLDEAKAMLQQNTYSLVLLEHDTEGSQGIRLLEDLLQSGVSVPFILLTEDADEKSVAAAIESGSWNCLARSQIDGVNLIRSMRYAMTLHSMQRDQQMAEQSLRKLSRAVEQSADTIFVTNRLGVIEYVNPAFEALTGFSSADVCGKNPRILKSGEQSGGTYQELWKTILAGNSYRGIFVNRKKNGDLYYTEETISPVRDTDGQITHFISNGRDLTEQVRLKAQLNQAQKMDAIGRLAGGVAHDFNNLLTIITSYAELGLDDAADRSPLQAKLKEIIQAARRAAELTRQLLAFSRKQPQALRVADLNQVIADIAKTLPRLIGEDIRFSFAAGEGLGRVRIDPVQIEQILMNLAANSRDAMPQGGHFRIETSSVMLDEQYVATKNAAIPLGRYSLITISDDGPGIPPADLPHIFEPFFTTKLPGKGTGLGLATVYGIVKQNGGFIWPYSEPHMGTVFKIYLPCVAEHSKAEETPDKPAEKAPRGSETVLLVEDETAVRNAVAELLRLQGYTVLEAKDGLDAVAMVKSYQKPIHLVVTDVVMPNMSGGQLAKELATLRPDAALLFVSGYPGRTVIDHEVFDLESNFLQKPYTLKQLSSKVRTTLDKKAAAMVGWSRV
jgi:two-component system cell cycle sensor histidine kinase/response regulator CckA